METSNKQENLQSIYMNFLILCKTCNEILYNSKEIERLCILLNELGLLFPSENINNSHLNLLNEIKIKNENSNSVDYNCLYKEIICHKCKSILGIYYISTCELLDDFKEKYILFENYLKFYSISESKFDNFREFCFENNLIEKNLDYLYILKGEKNSDDNKENENKLNKNNEYSEFNTLLKDVKNVVMAMNDGMKEFDYRLGQTENTVESLFMVVNKLNLKMKNL